MDPLEAAAIEEVPTIADGLDHELDPRKVNLDMLIGWIVAACLSPGGLIALLIVWLVGDLPRWAILLLWAAWLVLTAGLSWLAYAWPHIEHRHTRYKVDEDGLEIRRGVVWREVVSVPRSRVQHIDVSQGPFERSYGLGSLIVYTAGTDYSRVGLAGLSHDTALKLRDHLLPRGGDDAV